MHGRRSHARQVARSPADGRKPGGLPEASRAARNSARTAERPAGRTDRPNGQVEPGGPARTRSRRPVSTRPPHGCGQIEARAPALRNMVNARKALRTRPAAWRVHVTLFGTPPRSARKFSVNDWE
ncbi:hypothetical protein C725_0934 [Pacificimonas flava]|uniref:Uncharacterized protein n=1 Tax=Pacificimonas flava TaxID=1234595 RepID=M2U7H8_9SPHN|nr:hypothetical protein C725_0934 [Pacificimonas flava]